MILLLHRNQVICAFFVFLLIDVHAQDIRHQEPYIQKLGIHVAGQNGSLFKHTPKMDHFTYNGSPSFELSVFWQRAEKQGQMWYWDIDLPEFGIASQYTNIGNDTLLGHAFAVMPYLQFGIKEWKRAYWYFRVASGLAYLTKSFDRISNPENVAIGSEINNSSFFSTGIEWQLSKKISVQGGLFFKHFSNGAFKTPDLGLNFTGGQLALRYMVKDKLKFDYAERPPDLRFRYRFRIGYGLKEDEVIGGPRYPIYLAVFSPF